MTAIVSIKKSTGTRLDEIRFSSLFSADLIVYRSLIITDKPNLIRYHTWQQDREFCYQTLKHNLTYVQIPYRRPAR
jgi:hypothetical protein